MTVSAVSLFSRDNAEHSFGLGKSEIPQKNHTYMFLEVVWHTSFLYISW